MGRDNMVGLGEERIRLGFGKLNEKKKSVMQLPTGKANLMMNMNLLIKISERSYLSPCIFGGRKKESGIARPQSMLT